MKRFTLVEITLSIAIIGIGIAGIMALFPVGLNATRDAIGENYSASAAETLLGYFKHQYKKDCSWPTTMGLATLKNDCTENPIEDWIAIPLAGSKSMYIAGASTFGFKQFTGEGASERLDFTVVGRAWTSDVVIGTVNLRLVDGTPDDGIYQKAVRFNLELSWPASKPYASRATRYYMVEAFYNK